MNRLLPSVLITLALTPVALAQTPVRIGRTEDGRAVVTIAVPPSNDVNEDELKAIFDFGHTKGFLGPSSNPSDESGFSNADYTIIAVNHQPATKSSYVLLFLRSTVSGDITLINNVNTRVARLLRGKWATAAKDFLRIESIVDRNITFETVDFDTPNQEEFLFTLTFSRDGTFLPAQKGRPANTMAPGGGNKAGSAPLDPSKAQEGSTTVAPASGTLSRAEWRDRLKKYCTIPSGHQLLSNQKQLFAVMGKPDRVQREGRNTYWYYKCTDGVVQLAMQLDPDMIGGQVIAEVSDE